jgi:hypothetical protein
MTGATFYKNMSDIIDCDSILQQVRSSQGDFRTMEETLFKSENKEAMDLFQSWIDAGYDKDSVQWWNYYCGKHFDKSLINGLCKHFKVIPKKVWVSKIEPGQCFPLHWDIDEDVNRYYEDKKDPTFLRLQIHLDDYKFGHVFIIEDTPTIDHKKGDCYIWRDYKAWHGGANIGFEDKFQLNFLGVLE